MMLASIPSWKTDWCFNIVGGTPHFKWTVHKVLLRTDLFKSIIIMNKVSPCSLVFSNLPQKSYLHTHNTFENCTRSQGAALQLPIGIIRASHNPPSKQLALEQATFQVNRTTTHDQLGENPKQITHLPCLQPRHTVASSSLAIVGFLYLTENV